jgi:peroxin-1
MLQAAQDVIIELQPRRRPSPNKGAPTSPSFYVGWTGMQSKRRVTPREQDVPMIEMDATFARTLGLEEAEKVIQLRH